MDKVRTHFHLAIESEKKLQDGLNTSNQVDADDTIPSLHRAQGLLSNIRTEAKKHILTDQEMQHDAVRTRMGVIIFSYIAVILGIGLAERSQFAANLISKVSSSSIEVKA